jgi:hypothetical protein
MILCGNLESPAAIFREHEKLVPLHVSGPILVDRSLPLVEMRRYPGL